MRKYKLLMTLLLVGLAIATVSVRAEAEKKDDQFRTEVTEDLQMQDNQEQFLNIGSVSKVYTATAVMQLVDQGLVDLETPVTEYIPEFKMADERYKDITVRMLLNHTSGLMGSVYGGSLVFEERSSQYHDSFLEILANERLKYEPGEYNCYCNDGFTLLEILVEHVSKMSFTDYVKKNIAAPLGLEHTGTVWSMPNFDNQVPNYIDGYIKMAPECPQLIGTGGIMADAKDLCTFGSSFFKGNTLLLSEKAKSQMAENQMAGLCKECYGLGWDEVSMPDYEAAGVKVIQKGGDTAFQHASLTVAPEEEISIAVIASGGSSGVNEQLAKDLMQIALEEKGIEVGHPEKEEPKIVAQIPEEVKGYAGKYIYAGSILEVSFPKDQYMLVRSLAQSMPVENQYVYTENGSFIKVIGDVESGKAIPMKPVDEKRFEAVNGRVFLADDAGNYYCEKITEVDASDSAQKAWDDRNGVKYYCINLKYNDILMLDAQTTVTLDTYDAVKGYVSSCAIIDENHAKSALNIPGTVSRDVSDMEITQEDGCEILNMKDWNMSYISEKNIPDYSSDITEVSPKTGNAVWYRLNGATNETVKFDIPKNAAVYVFDQFGQLKYSSFMASHSDCIPLPEYGMIVFIGDTGAKISICR